MCCEDIRADLAVAVATANEALGIATQTRASVTLEINEAIRELVEAGRSREEAILQSLIDQRAEARKSTALESGEPEARPATQGRL